MNSLNSIRLDQITQNYQAICEIHTIKKGSKNIYIYIYFKRKCVFNFDGMNTHDAIMFEQLNT